MNPPQPRQWGPELVIPFDQLQTHTLFLLAIGLLMAATQVVVWVLSKLEERRFGTVMLGTLITPLCTGFPNLMIGLFGQERLQGDLVLRLNIGNNLANTSLVAGLLLLIAGPLQVRPGKGSSKAAKRANADQLIALIFLWLGAIACFWLARDGHITRQDGLILTAIYLGYQVIAYRRRGNVSKKHHLPKHLGFVLLLALGLAAWVIQLSIEGLGIAMDRVDNLLPGWHLGLFLGLLTVIPESFLLLRLASRQGSLGLSGLIGDCLVSIPLVVGLSACFHPFDTAPIQQLTDPAARPFIGLGFTMLALSVLSFKEGLVSRKVGIIFLLSYATVWVLTTF